MTVASRGMPSTVYAIPISVISTGHFEYERTNEMLKAIRKSAKDVDEDTDASRHGVFIIQSMTEDEKTSVIKCRTCVRFMRYERPTRFTDMTHVLLLLLSSSSSESLTSCKEKVSAIARSAICPVSAPIRRGGWCAGRTEEAQSIS